MDDDRQHDLFADPPEGKAAQRATQERRSKPPCPAPSPATEPLPLPLPGSGVGRDEKRVLRFPVSVWAPSLWRHRVETVARVYAGRKTEKGRSNFWSSTINTLARQMHRRGATEGEIEAELARFRDAVTAELSCLHDSGPGAA